MTITVEWYEEEKLNIHAEFPGMWMWDEIQPVFDEIISLLDSVDYPANLIINLLASHRLPSIQISEMTQFAHAPILSHPNMAELLAVGMEGYSGVVFRVFKRIFPDAAARYKLFENLAELDAYLAESKEE